jgi:hypothetical protein
MWRGRSSSTSDCGPNRSPPCGPRRRLSPLSCSLKLEPRRRRRTLRTRAVRGVADRLLGVLIGMLRTQTLYQPHANDLTLTLRVPERSSAGALKPRGCKARVPAVAQADQYWT